MFGHKRLAIIDLTEKAAQPFVSTDKRYSITYNGEVYNYRELREECAKLGSTFKSQSDTEVIVECYRHWGTQAFKRFRGMWAFALFDCQMNQVVLCRDPFGIKPLYYGIKSNVLFFASEQKALRVADGYFSDIDEATVVLFEQYGYIERENWTFFQRICRFPQAHYAVINLVGETGHIDPVAYWTPPDKILKIKKNDAAQELKRLLFQSVDLHLRSDVPVGSCLSGGIDSSAIVCIGSSLTSGSGRFNTFTTSYPDHKDIDETLWAQKVIDHTNSLPHYTQPTFDSFLKDLERLIYFQDEPFGSTSIYAQYSVFKRISTSAVKVILDGQGADELLAGYHSLLNIYLNYLFAQGKGISYLSEGFHIAHLYDQPLYSMYYDTLNFIKNRLNTIIHRIKEYVPGIQNHLCDEVEHRLRILHSYPTSFEQYLTDMVMKTNLPELLRYEDRNSMAFSIESRVPFLDTDLAGFALALPAEYKIQRGVTKYILREALKGIIPEEIRMRVDKLGFPAPERAWLKKGFGIDVDNAGSTQWRQLVVNKWRTMLKNTSPC